MGVAANLWPPSPNAKALALLAGVAAPLVTIATWWGVSAAKVQALVGEEARLLVGSIATGSTICPVDPVSGDTVTVAGTTYTVYRTSDDAGTPDHGINCTGTACATADGCATAVLAAIAANNSARVVAGADGGVVYLSSKDAGMAANVPIVWRLQTRITATDTNTRTATVTNTATSTVTSTLTNTNSDTVTITATATVTITLTDTMTVTLTDTNSETYTDTTTALSTDTDTGTATQTATETQTSTDTSTATGTNTATATGTATGTNTATVTSSRTTTNTVTSVGTNTGMQNGVDPVVRGGPTLGIIPNDFDPTVSGLNAPLQSVARTVDGSKAWTKTGTGATNWKAVGEE